MEVVPGRKGAGAAHEGDRGSGAHLIAYLFEEFLVMLVDGDYVPVMLYLDCVSRLVAPSGVDYGAVEGRLDYGAGRGGDVDVRVDCRVKSLGDNAFERCEEMKALYGQIPLVAVGNPEALLLLDMLSEGGVLPRHLLYLLLCGLCARDGIYEAVYLQGLLAFDDPAQILGIELPAVDYVLEGVDSHRIVDCGPFGMGVGIAWDEGPDRGERYDGVDYRREDDQNAHQCHEEACPCEMDGEQMLVCLVFNQRQTEPVGFIVAHNSFFLNFAPAWTESSE